MDFNAIGNFMYYIVEYSVPSFLFSRSMYYFRANPAIQSPGGYL
jgi:hypothetical protein